tara:strand:+ start:225 stop:1112 length:888 start_codon:yes stop_codon:yes gene_type:complete
MKINSALLILLIITASSCTLEGVSNKNDDTNNLLSDTSSTLDTILVIEENTVKLKTDTLIDGQVNEMVWNGENGLRIEWDKKSKNSQIKLDDVVLVNYKARVARGEVYDSNDEIGIPVPLKTGIGQLIEGWEIALLQMHSGDIGRLMIPSKLAYGEGGLIGVIPQNADIVVDIEITSVVEPILLEDGVKVYKYESIIEGAYPQKNQAIKFDYFAFKTGKKPGLYDNSYERGTPYVFNFQNDNVIDGLHIGFSQIRANEKAFIHIPAKSAYGSKGLADLIPPNTDIIFDVRVESVK